MERNGKRDRDTEINLQSLITCFILQTTATEVLGQVELRGNPYSSTTCIQEPKVLGPAPAAFPGILAESWIRNPTLWA